MNIKPIHKALKKLQDSPIGWSDNFYSEYLDDFDHAQACNRNAVTEMNDFYRCERFLRGELLPENFEEQAYLF